MADKRKLQAEEARRQARRRNLATIMLMQDVQDPIAIDREFRTPIYDGRDLPSHAVASTTPDNQSPSLSRIAIADELRKATSIEDYLNRVAPTFQHEKIHVLQNIDNTPFAAADVAMRNNLERVQRARYQNLLSHYPVREVQAYSGSNTIDHNEDLKKATVRFDEAWPDNGLGRFFTNKTFEQDRQDKLGDLRKHLINSLPLGLQNIIGGWSK